MRRRLPADAFDHYFAMGLARSYQAVAEQFQVSKRAVTNRATKERWQERVAEIEAKAKEASTQRMIETVEEMNLRHLKLLRVVLARAVEALREHPLRTGLEGARAIEMVIRLERLIRGEASERTAVQVEEVLKRQHERWLKVLDDEASAREAV